MLCYHSTLVLLPMMHYQKRGQRGQIWYLKIDKDNGTDVNLLLQFLCFDHVLYVAARGKLAGCD